MSSIQIPGYRILQQLGEGGMSTVYLAEQLSFERRVALKVLTAHRAETEQFGRRFLREVKIAASLSHPSIVTVYDTGIVDGSYFLAMEYLPGADLRARIENGVPLLESLDIVTAMADAVDYAAEQGVVHRDLKPANVMFRSDGSPAIVDFGIARDIASNTEVTQAGTILGTPRYMSPEQALGEEVDARSDLYSIGIIFYEMLSGDVPFKASSAAGLGAQHITSEVPALPESTEIFEPVVQKLLAKKSEDRYQSGEQLILDLDEIREQMPPDLGTTILLSKPRAALGSSGRSGISSARSKRRRRTRATKAQRDGSQWVSYLSNAIIALLVSGAVAFAALWFSREKSVETQSVPVASPVSSASLEQRTAGVPATAGSPAISEEERENLLRTARDTLDRAEQALSQGQVDVASDYLEIVGSLSLKSEEIAARVALVSAERERMEARAQRLTALEAVFEQRMDRGDYYLPAGEAAFDAVLEMEKHAQSREKLGVLRQRLDSATRSAVKEVLRSGGIAAAQARLGKLEGRASNTLLSQLAADISRVREEQRSHSKKLRTLRGSLDSLVGAEGSMESSRKILAASEDLLRLQPNDAAAAVQKEQVLQREYQRVESALSARDFDTAEQAIDLLEDYDFSAARISSLELRMKELEGKRQSAEQQLEIAQDVLDQMRDEEVKYTQAFHVGQAASLVRAYTAVFAAGSLDAQYSRVDGVLAELNAVYDSRFALLAEDDQYELAEIYVRALSEGGFADQGVASMLDESEEKLKSMKRLRRRSFTTF